MLDKLTIDDFLPLVGSSFWLFHGDHKVEMRLERAAPVMASEAARLKRQAFSLYFLAPLVVPQGIHRVKHDPFPEPLDSFVVPIGQEPNGFTHEAVFT